MEEDINSAMRKGYFQQVRLLARLGADVNARDELGRTSLMNCALVDDDSWGVGLARTLLEHGARTGPRDRLGLTALHHACLRHRPAFVHVLLGAADFDVRAADRRGNAALHYAAATGDRAATTALLAVYRRYRLPIDAANRAGQTALEFAFRSEHMDCVEMIREAEEAIRDATAAARVSPKSSSAGSKQSSKMNGVDGAGMRRGQPSAASLKGCNGLVNGRSSVDNECSNASESRTASALVDVNGEGSTGVDEAVSRQRLSAVAARGQGSPTTAMSMTATSARQQRADQRPRNVVRDQLGAAASTRPSLAVRVSRRMIHGPGELPVSGADTRSTSDGPATAAAATSVDWNVDELIPPAALNGRTFRAASVRDPHCRPLVKILRQSAVEFFDEESCTDSYRSSTDQQANGSGNDVDWRAKILRLYSDYAYQFTPLYKRPATCPPPAPPTDSASTYGGAPTTRNSSTSDATLLGRIARKQSGTTPGPGGLGARKKSYIFGAGSPGTSQGPPGTARRGVGHSASSTSLVSLGGDVDTRTVHRRTSQMRTADPVVFN